MLVDLSAKLILYSPNVLLQETTCSPSKVESGLNEFIKLRQKLVHFSSNFSKMCFIVYLMSSMKHGIRRRCIVLRQTLDVLDIPRGCSQQEGCVSSLVFPAFLEQCLLDRLLHKINQGLRVHNTTINVDMCGPRHVPNTSFCND